MRESGVHKHVCYELPNAEIGSGDIVKTEIISEVEVKTATESPIGKEEDKIDEQKVFDYGC